MKIIILDEPTANLDPFTKRGIWKYIERLRGEKSIFLATHSMDEAESMSNRCDFLGILMLTCVPFPS